MQLRHPRYGESNLGIRQRRGFGLVHASDGVASFVVMDEINPITPQEVPWAAPVAGHCLGGAPTLAELHNVSVAECKARCVQLPACHGISFSESDARCNVEAGAVVPGAGSVDLAG